MSRRIDLANELRAFCGIDANKLDALARIGDRITSGRYNVGGSITADEALLLKEFADYVAVSARLLEAGFTTAGEKADEASALPDYPLPVERLYE